MPNDDARRRAEDAADTCDHVPAFDDWDIQGETPPRVLCAACAAGALAQAVKEREHWLSEATIFARRIDQQAKEIARLHEELASYKGG